MARAKWNAAVASREEQHSQKRMAVLTAGVALFNSNGYERTTLDDIANALNVTKRTIYYYVESKDDILFECMKLGLTFAREAVEKSSLPGQPPLERIRILVAEYIRWVQTDFGACLALLRDLNLSEERRQELRQSKSQLNNHPRGLLNEGIAAGSIRPCDPKLVTFAITGALNRIGDWYRPDGELSVDAISDSFAEHLTQGLVP